MQHAAVHPVPSRPGRPGPRRAAGFVQRRDERRPVDAEQALIFVEAFFSAGTAGVSLKAPPGSRTSTTWRAVGSGADRSAQERRRPLPSSGPPAGSGYATGTLRAGRGGNPAALAFGVEQFRAEDPAATGRVVHDADWCGICRSRRPRRRTLLRCGAEHRHFRGRKRVVGLGDVLGRARQAGGALEAAGGTPAALSSAAAITSAQTSVAANAAHRRRPLVGPRSREESRARDQRGRGNEGRRDRVEAARRRDGSAVAPTRASRG